MESAKDVEEYRAFCYLTTMQYIIAIAALFAVWLLFSFHEQQRPAARPDMPTSAQSYYEQVFNYTMDNIRPGNRFAWQTYNAKGSIAVTGTLVSKSGYTCRSFTESYSILGGAPESDKGYGCKRIGRDGWCKLTSGEALTCAMENSYYSVSLPELGPAPGVPDINVSAPDVDTGGGMHSNFDVAPSGPGRRNANANDAADAVTGAAGSAAGYIARNAKGWFSNLFR